MQVFCNLSSGNDFYTTPNYVMADFAALVSNAFNTLTPNLEDIYNDAIKYSATEWKDLQRTLVAASGAASVSIPILHLAGIPADIAFLMNRMSVCAYGIGSIIGYKNKMGNILEAEDFPVILARWCKDESLSNAAIAKTSAELSVKMGSQFLARELAKNACKHTGIFIGQKMGGKLGSKLGGKFATKLGAKIPFGFIPILGAVIGGGVNYYFIAQIQEEAESWYNLKCKL